MGHIATCTIGYKLQVCKDEQRFGVNNILSSITDPAATEKHRADLSHILLRKNCKVQNLQSHRAHLAGVEALEAFTEAAAGKAGGMRALGETGRHAAGDATGDAAGPLSSLDLVVVRGEARGVTALATKSTKSTKSARWEAARSSAGGNSARGEARGVTALATKSTESAESARWEAARNSARGNSARGNSARGSGLLSTTGGIGPVNVLGR
jgi:hypothetical protein